MYFTTIDYKTGKIISKLELKCDEMCLMERLYYCLDYNPGSGEFWNRMETYVRECFNITGNMPNLDWRYAGNNLVGAKREYNYEMSWINMRDHIYSIKGSEKYEKFNYKLHVDHYRNYYLIDSNDNKILFGRLE